MGDIQRIPPTMSTHQQSVQGFLHFLACVMQSERKIVIVMRGPSGVGKSTLTRKILNMVKAKGKDGECASADDFFYTSEGFYNFNRDQQGEAHSECRKNFVRFLEKGTAVVCVDNTSMKTWEYKSYIQQAETHDYKVIVVEFGCELCHDKLVALCDQQNVHAVGRENIERQILNYEPNDLEEVDFGTAALNRQVSKVTLPVFMEDPAIGFGNLTTPIEHASNLSLKECINIVQGWDALLQSYNINSDKADVNETFRNETFMEACDALCILLHWNVHAHGGMHNGFVLIMRGPAGSGKSTLANILKKFLGPEIVSIVSCDSYAQQLCRTNYAKALPLRQCVIVDNNTDIDSEAYKYYIEEAKKSGHQVIIVEMSSNLTKDELERMDNEGLSQAEFESMFEGYELSAHPEIYDVNSPCGTSIQKFTGEVVRFVVPMHVPTTTETLSTEVQVEDRLTDSLTGVGNSTTPQQCLKLEQEDPLTHPLPSATTVRCDSNSTIGRRGVITVGSRVEVTEGSTPFHKRFPPGSTGVVMDTLSPGMVAVSFDGITEIYDTWTIFLSPLGGEGFHLLGGTGLVFNSGHAKAMRSPNHEIDSDSLEENTK